MSAARVVPSRVRHQRSRVRVVLRWVRWGIALSGGVLLLALFLAPTPYMLAIGLNAFTAWLAPAWLPVLQAMFSGGLLPGSPVNGLLPLAAFGFLGWLGWLAGGRQAAPHH